MKLLELGPINVSALQEPLSGYRVYAILDICDAPKMREKLEKSSAKSACLYRGRLDEDLLSIAPFLVAVNEDVLSWLMSDFWTEPWGIFVLSKADFETIWRHLRKFLVVQSPNGDPWYFRYYDPRVMPPFLASCSLEELKEFFGPIGAYVFVDYEGVLHAAELRSR